MDVGGAGCFFPDVEFGAARGAAGRPADLRRSGGRHARRHAGVARYLLDDHRAKRPDPGDRHGRRPARGDPCPAAAVVAFTHGVWGVAEKCAPSLSPNFWTWTAGLKAVPQRLCRGRARLPRPWAAPESMACWSGRTPPDRCSTRFVPRSRFPARPRATALPSGAKARADMPRSGPGRGLANMPPISTWSAWRRRRRRPI